MKNNLNLKFAVIILMLIGTTVSSFTTNQKPKHLCRLYVTEYKCVGSQVTISTYNMLGQVVESHPGGGCAGGPWSFVIRLVENNSGQIVDESLTSAIKNGFNVKVNATAPTLSNPQPIVKYIRGSDLTNDQYNYFKKYDQ